MGHHLRPSFAKVPPTNSTNITPDFEQVVRPESTGGTPANRLVHQESQQLFIGSYVIDTTRQVWVVPYAQAPGRYTGPARHMTQPTQKVYTGVPPFWWFFRSLRVEG